MEEVAVVKLYTGKEGRFLVKLVDCADYMEDYAESIWQENYFAFRKFTENWGMSVLASKNRDDFFLMDRAGNEIVKAEDGSEEKTGWRVNGPEDKNLGSWEEIFIPVEFANEKLSVVIGCEDIWA